MPDDLKARAQAVAMRRMLLGPPLSDMIGGKPANSTWARQWVGYVMRSSNGDREINHMSKRTDAWVEEANDR